MSDNVNMSDCLVIMSDCLGSSRSAGSPRPAESSSALFDSLGIASIFSLGVRASLSSSPADITLCLVNSSLLSILVGDLTLCVEDPFFSSFV